MRNKVIFDRETLRRFRKAYLHARAQGRDSFKFQGLEFVMQYAKSLLEYLNFYEPERTISEHQRERKHQEDENNKKDKSVQNPRS